ncbi:MAG: hypothetical protein ABIJ09_05875 [Pseudomonadota bacterium]
MHRHFPVSRKGPALLLALGALLLGLGCSTMNTARPLEPGQHAVGLTAGGPLIGLFGIVLPLPNSTLEGRSGVMRLAGRPLDVNYGLQLTSLLFGDVGGHLGASYLLVPQRGYLPALSIADRQYLFSNHLDGRKPAELRGLWAVNQLEATVSYKLFSQLLYGGLVEYLDFSNPGLLMAPFAGVEFHPGLDWLGLQLEARYLVPWRNNRQATPQWVAPFDQGGMLVTAGVSVRFDLGAGPEVQP